MGQTLSHGVYLPNEGERNCYAGLASNWQILNTAVGAIAEKAPLVHTHTVSQITDFPAYGTTAGTICEGNDSRLSDARTPVAHTHGKADITDLFNSANTWTAQINQNQGDANYYNVFATNAVKGDLTKNGSFDLLLKDKTNGNINSSGIAILSLRQDSEGSYAGFQVDTIGSTDQTRHNASIALRIRPSTNDNSAELVPGRNETISLGSSSYQWNNLYAKNYYYNGVAWGLDKQNVWTSAQKIAANPAAWNMKNTTYTLGTAPSSNRYLGFIFYDSADTDMGRLCVQCHKNGNNYYILGLRNSDGTNIYDGALKYSASQTNERAFYPEGDTDLGTSTNKWATLNGINPGALSLPNSSAAIQLDTTGWDLTGATNISYTSSFDGWLELRCQDVAGDYLFATCNEYRQSVTGSGSITAVSAGLALTIPVRANVSISIIVKASNKFKAYLTPCLGNV